MAGILTDVGLVATNLFATATTAVTTVTANPLLMVFMCIAIVYAGIKIFKALRG